ncbi:DUF1499 domain-containing protein [Leptolyngbyaceae cyanobacterium UHCC 1019]
MVSQFLGKLRSFWRSTLISVLFASMLITVIGWFGFVNLATAYPSSPTKVIAMAGSLFSFSGSRPTNLGLTDGKLAACPSSPNCVSSQSQDDDHRIEPLRYEGTPTQAIAQLKTTIESLPRTKIIQTTDTYLYAEFTSALMGFVDDVEFYVNPAESVIEVRSASRLGESDLGVNRQRIEAIRSAIEGLA